MIFDVGCYLVLFLWLIVGVVDGKVFFDLVEFYGVGEKYLLVGVDVYVGVLVKFFNGVVVLFLMGVVLW